MLLIILMASLNKLQKIKFNHHMIRVKNLNILIEKVLIFNSSNEVKHKSSLFCELLQSFLFELKNIKIK